VLLTDTLYLHGITLRDGKQTPHMVKTGQRISGTLRSQVNLYFFFYGGQNIL